MKNNSAMLGFETLSLSWGFIPFILHFNYMNFFSQILGISSSCIYSLSVSPNTNQAIVEWKNGSKFMYNNVDFDAILDLLCGEYRSLGKFVNAYCKGNNAVQLNVGW